MNFLTEAEREGWIGWLANPPPLGQHIQKVNTRKNKRNYLGPQNVEIRAIAMHANADNLVPMVLFPGFTKLKCRIIDSSVV